MAITDYIPNIFGATAPSSYESLLGMGLLTPEQVQKQQNVANIQGLLGAGLSLAQGMGRTGPRRSAAENILGALAGGFGAAGGAYQQGLQNVVQQQQLQSAALTQKQALDRVRAIEEAKVKYPDLAQLALIDTGKFAEEVALRERIKGMPGGAGKIETPEQYRALGQQYLAGGPNLKPLGEAYMKQADVLELTSLGNLRGDESPEELDRRSNRANAIGSKEMAEKLFGLAEQKRMYPNQISAQVPSQAPVKQDLAQRAEMPEGRIITSTGEAGGFGKPNFAAGERYADEALNAQFKTDRVATPVEVVADRGRQGQLQLKIDNISKDIERISGMRPTAANRKEVKDLTELKDKYQIDLNRFANMEYDFGSIKQGLPKKYHSEIDAVAKLAEAGTLDAAGIRSSIEKFYTRLQEDEKGRKLEGNAATFAQMKFGVTDRAQLTGQQLSEILRFENAPNAEQLAKLQQENARIQYETGRGVTLPSGRSSMIVGGTNVPVAGTTQVEPAVTTTSGAPVQALRVTPSVKPSVSQQAPTVSQVIDPKVYKNPLINRPDSEVPPKKKQELIQAQPGLIGATNYTIKNIVDARNAAQSLLDNPAYMNSISGMTAPAISKIPGTDAYTANEILNNILGRSFISEIQEMRSNSPTGGAVGNVAVAEMNSLSKIRGALTLGMNKDELKKQLESYIANANRAMKTIPNDYARTYGYNGEFDELLASEVVSPKPTTQALPAGVKVRPK